MAKYCVISDISRIFRVVDPNVCPIQDELVIATISGIFHENNAKLHVIVVTLSINDNIRFLGNISWSKYRSEITVQTKSNNLNYLIDSIFSNINRLFVLLCK